MFFHSDFIRKVRIKSYSTSKGWEKSLNVATAATLLVAARGEREASGRVHLNQQGASAPKRKFKFCRPWIWYHPALNYFSGRTSKPNFCPLFKTLGHEAATLQLKNCIFPKNNFSRKLGAWQASISLPAAWILAVKTPLFDFKHLNNGK